MKNNGELHDVHGHKQEASHACQLMYKIINYLYINKRSEQWQTHAAAGKAIHVDIFRPNLSSPMLHLQ
jgi:hypothetical protein